MGERGVVCTAVVAACAGDDDGEWYEAPAWRPVALKSACPAKAVQERRSRGNAVAGEAAPQEKRAPLLDRATGAIAVIGGLIALATALTVTASVVSRNLLDEAIPGDFEYVQMGTAIAVFCFLPLCQLRRGN